MATAGMDENNDTEDVSSKGLTVFPGSILKSKNIVRLLIDYNNIKELPEDFGNNFPCLQFFSAIGNNLATLPESFGNLIQLEEIYLNENVLNTLHNSFCNLKKLLKFQITGNLLEVLPVNFGELISLELLHCEENNLKKLPKTFGLLENLKELELGSNRLEAVLEGFGMLRALAVLNLSNNKLTGLPETFGNLPRVRKLDLSSNKIKFLPSKFESVHCIEKFFIESNLLQEIPSWFEQLSSITELSVQDNGLQDAPLSETFPLRASKLKHLDMSANYISSLPESFGQLSALEYIHFGTVIDELERRNFQNGNWLRILPDSFCQLSVLRELHLEENRITELPDNFGDLVSLEIIDLGQNMLHVLPDSFGCLQSLRVCFISKNQLQWLPSNFGDLSKLEELRLDDNALVELPESFCNLTSLTGLDLFNNRLTEIPEALNSLKKLIKLDIHLNDFHVPYTEVPELMKVASYPERDPKLADNWRGRRQKDISSIKDITIKEDEVTGPIDFEPPPPSLSYNEDCLIHAIRRSNAIWRGHGQDGERRSSRRNVPDRQCSSQSDHDSENGYCDDDNDSDDDCCDEEEDADDDFEPPILVQVTQWSGLDESTINKPMTSTTHIDVQALLEETECWDEEVDNNIEQYDNVPVVYQHPTKIIYPPVLNGPFTFAPYDIHVPDYVKQPSQFSVIDDQFDNCDDDSTEEVSVDPVF